MKKNNGKKLKHCCDFMEFILKEKKVAIYYNPIFREYFIKLRSFPNGKHTIYNCPWCGYKFPKSLVNKYYETLKNEYNISYDPFHKKYCEILENYDELDRELPEEFKNDKWWKKRKL